MRRHTLVVLLFLTLVPLCAQQPQPQRPVFRADAHFVLVDAYPLRDGKVVTGLTAADFEVREEGVLQNIESFEFVEGGNAEPESSRRDPNTVAEAREAVADPRARAFVVDLDIDHVSIAGSHRIRVPLVQMLNEMLGPNDLFGVISTEHEPGSITFARKVTTTEDMLARYWSWGMRDTLLRDPEEQGIIDCFGSEVTATGIVDRYFEDEGRRRHLPDVIIERYRESKVLDHLEDLVAVLGHLREGRTSVVLVTEGWRLSPPDQKLLAEIARTQRNGPPSPAKVQGRLTMHDSVTEGARDACMQMADNIVRNEGGQRLREVINRANQRNISFIPVNPSGLIVFDGPASEVGAPGGFLPGALALPGTTPVVEPTRVLEGSLNRVTTRETGLRTLAENTDGIAILGNNDLRAGFRRVSAELRSFYLLGYYSTNRAFDGKVRRISVKARDYEVRARRSYAAPTEAERAARANPVAAAGPSPVERALDVLSGLRSAEDRTFDVSRYLKADAAPVLGVSAVFRATPSPRSPLIPVKAPVFTRRERLHIEWPVVEALVSRSARLLGRNSAPLAVGVTLTERDGPSGLVIAADALLAALAPGDYVVELRVTSASGDRTALVAFRVVP